MLITLGVGETPYKHPVVAIRSEIVQRYPATQEGLAMQLGQNGSNMTVAMRNMCLEALYEGVCNLVYKEAVRFAPSCPHLDVEDMVQDCWHRIIKKLHLYKADREKFTTWVVKVAYSVLSKIYRRGKRYSDRYSEMEEGNHDRCGEDKATERVWKRDFQEAIQLLKKEYPEKAHITQALFYDNDGDLRPKIVFKLTADECNISAQKVSDFYHQFVKSFFYKIFQGEYCNE
jgi:RNA polymerase sigma factor (sigma-70 family)